MDRCTKKRILPLKYETFKDMTAMILTFTMRELQCGSGTVSSNQHVSMDANAD